MIALLLALAAPTPSPGPNVATPARQRAGSISDADYPAAAIRTGSQGTSRMRISVGRTGAVTACEIIGSSGSPVLDATSCSLVQERFKYAPGLDAAGRPVESIVNRSVTWRLPADDGVAMAAMLPEFSAGQMRLAIHIDTVGPRCAVETSGTAWSLVSEMICPEAARAPIAELITRRGAIMTVTSLVPEDAAATAAGGAPGNLVGRTAADLEISGSGMLVECRDVAVTNPSPNMPSFCSSISTGTRMFRPDAAGQARRGRVTVEVYSLGTTGT